MKKTLCILCLLLACLAPMGALAALEWTPEKGYINFPALDGLRGRFNNVEQWTLIDRDNLDQYIHLPMARGESEKAIRERFEDETLLFEAYADFLPDDVCVRVEVFEDAASREIWNLRYLSTKERNEFKTLLNDGEVLEKYDTFHPEFEGSQHKQYVRCGFTTRPPYAYESGEIAIHYVNGRCYVITYAAYHRAASWERLRTGSENGIINKTAVSAASFKTEHLKNLPDFELTEAMPTHTGSGEMAVSGTTQKGAKVTALLDGENLSVKTDKKGNFNFRMELAAGEHQLVITTTHKDHSDRVETYTITASDQLTPLTLTEYPEAVALAGKQQISGKTIPHARVTLTLDDREPILLAADGEGRFDFTLRVMDDLAHFLTVTAQGEGQDENAAAVLFVTEYETFKAGLKAFEKGLTKESIANMAKAPDSFVGEKVKISVKVKELLYTREGLGVLCTYNPPKGTRHEKTPLYLKLYSFAQDQIYEGMTMTVYGLVDGEETFLSKDGNETRLRILMQYGTYLT